jgi:hypothetical protein
MTSHVAHDATEPPATPGTGGPPPNAMADIQKASPGYFVSEFGDASTDNQIEGAFLNDLAKAGMLSLPLTSSSSPGSRG